MSFNFKTEEYYKRFIELQEKLRKSEEERLKLEMKFNEMVRVTREEEQIHYRKLRAQYKRFLEEDRRRQNRNERILRTLERIESRVAVLVAKTERFKLLRQQYQTFLDRVYKANQNTKPKTPEILKGKENVKQTRFTDDGNDVVQTYLQNLSSNKLREMLKREEEAIAKLPTTEVQDLEYKYGLPELYRFNDDRGCNYANSIADDIMDSIYSRNLPSASSKLKQSKEFNNNIGSTSASNEPKNITSEVDDTETDDFSESEEILYKNPSEFNKTNLKTGIMLNKSLKDGLQDPLLGANDKVFFKQLNDESLHVTAPENAQETCPIKATEAMDPLDKQLINSNSVNKDLLDKRSSFSRTNEDISYSKKSEVAGDGTVLRKDDIIDKKGKIEECENNVGDNIKRQDKSMYEAESEHFSQKPEVNKAIELVLEEAKEQNEPVKGVDLQRPEHLELVPEQPHIELSIQQNVQHLEESKQLISMNEEYKKENVVEEKADKPEQQYDLNYSQPKVPSDEQQVQHYENAQFEPRYDETKQPIEHHAEDIHPIQQYNEQGQTAQSFDQQSVQQYDEHGQPVQSFDQQSELIQQYDEHGQVIQSFDQQSELMQQYDEYGQPVYSYDQQQYDEQYLQGYEGNAQYDEHGQFIPQYDEHGQLIQQYDGQVMQQYDENGQLIQQYDNQYDANQQYDENGQLIQQYGYGEDPSQSQYDENGQLIQQSQSQYDENGQLMQQSQAQYDENGQLMQHAEPQYDETVHLAQQPYEDQQHCAQDEHEKKIEKSNEQNLNNVAPVTEDVDDKSKIETRDETEEPKKTSNVMEMLDTDSESVKQDTKVSHDSDFDFSNG